MKNKRTLYTLSFPVLLATCFLVALLLWSCSGKSEEDLLRETVNKIGDYAENKKLDGILFYLSEDYQDDEDRTYEDIESLIDTYLGRFYGIAVNTLGTNIISLAPPDAEIETDVALSSGAAKLFRKAVRYSGQFYRFTLKMKKEGDHWKCTGAAWKYITLDELFPESFKILKKLFPGSF